MHGLQCRESTAMHIGPTSGHAIVASPFAHAALQFRPALQVHQVRALRDHVQPSAGEAAAALTTAKVLRAQAPASAFRPAQCETAHACAAAIAPSLPSPRAPYFFLACSK